MLGTMYISVCWHLARSGVIGWGKNLIETHHFVCLSLTLWWNCLSALGSNQFGCSMMLKGWYKWIIIVCRDWLVQNRNCLPLRSSIYRGLRQHARGLTKNPWCKNRRTAPVRKSMVVPRARWAIVYFKNKTVDRSLCLTMTQVYFAKIDKRISHFDSNYEMRSRPPD